MCKLLCRLSGPIRWKLNENLKLGIDFLERVFNKGHCTNYCTKGGKIYNKSVMLPYKDTNENNYWMSQKENLKWDRASAWNWIHTIYMKNQVPE